MIIIPYIYSEYITKLHKIITITILCNGGNTLWIEPDMCENNIDTNIMIPNELYTCSLPIITTCLGSACVFIEIDITRTNINNMFNWREVLPEPDILCWRSFKYINNIHDNTKWLDIPDNVYIGEYNIKQLLSNIKV